MLLREPTAYHQSSLLVRNTVTPIPAAYVKVTVTTTTNVRVISSAFNVALTKRSLDAPVDMKAIQVSQVLVYRGLCRVRRLFSNLVIIVLFPYFQRRITVTIQMLREEHRALKSPRNLIMYQVAIANRRRNVDFVREIAMTMMTAKEISSATSVVDMIRFQVVAEESPINPSLTIVWNHEHRLGLTTVVSHWEF